MVIDSPLSSDDALEAWLSGRLACPHELIAGQGQSDRKWVQRCLFGLDRGSRRQIQVDYRGADERRVISESLREDSPLFGPFSWDRQQVLT